jgi:predicted DNA-binding protein
MEEPLKRKSSRTSDIIVTKEDLKNESSKVYKTEACYIRETW